MKKCFLPIVISFSYRSIRQVQPEVAAVNQLSVPQCNNSATRKLRTKELEILVLKEPVEQSSIRVEE